MWTFTPLNANLSTKVVQSLRKYEEEFLPVRFKTEPIEINEKNWDR
jgi:hypothetical protein